MGDPLGVIRDPLPPGPLPHGQRRRIPRRRPRWHDRLRWRVNGARLRLAERAYKLISGLDVPDDGGY